MSQNGKRRLGQCEDSLTEYYKVHDTSKLIVLEAILILYYSLGRTDFEKKLLGLYGVPFKLIPLYKKGNHVNFYRNDFPNSQIKAFKNFISSFKKAGYVYIPKSDLFIALDNCLQENEMVGIDVKEIYSNKTAKKIVQYVFDRTEIVYTRSCNTFSHFYEHIFKPNSDFKKVTIMSFSYDLFQGYSFQKLSKLLKNSMNLNKVEFKNIIQEDIFYLELLRLQKNRKNMKICLNFDNQVDIIIFGKRSKIEFIFNEILKYYSYSFTFNELNKIEKSSRFEIMMDILKSFHK